MEYSYFGTARQEGMHLILLDMLEATFGELPPVLTDQVKVIESQEKLAALGIKMLSAESLAGLGLNGTV